MFKMNHNNSGNKPSPEIVKEALRLWGKSAKKLTWEVIDLGNRNQFEGRIKTFHCPGENACEMIELHSFKYRENGDDRLYGIGRCLSCAKIYWGKL